MTLPQHLADRADAILAGDLGSIDNAPRRGADIFTGEAEDYPREWSGFIGQRRAKEDLRVKIASAQARNARLDHTLFGGGRGLGKTTLAHLTAAELAVGLIVTTAPLGPDEFYEQMRGMEDRDILFVDEVHLLTKGGQNKADWLLPWMLGGGVKTSMGMKKTPDVTLLAATTDPGRLPGTMLDRFMSTPAMTDYTADEAALIVRNNAARMGVDLAEEHWPAVAQAADRNPRVIRKILIQIRDLQYTLPDTHPNLERALIYAGRSADGLSVLARHILVALVLKRGYTASLATICDELGDPGDLRHDEQALKQRGLIEIVGQGRRLTDLGVRRARQEVGR